MAKDRETVEALRGVEGIYEESMGGAVIRTPVGGNMLPANKWLHAISPAGLTLAGIDM